MLTERDIAAQWTIGLSGSAFYENHASSALASQAVSCFSASSLATP